MTAKSSHETNVFKTLRTMLAIGIAMLALALFGPPALAADCVPLANSKTQAENVPGATLTILDGDALKKAGEIFNAVTGTDRDIATAVLLELPGDGGGILGVGPAGAVCLDMHFTPDRWKTLRLSIFGRPA